MKTIKFCLIKITGKFMAWIYMLFVSVIKAIFLVKIATTFSLHNEPFGATFGYI